MNNILGTETYLTFSAIFSCLVKYTCLSSHCQFLLLYLFHWYYSDVHISLAWRSPHTWRKVLHHWFTGIGLLCPKLIREILSLVLLIQNTATPVKANETQLFLRSSLKGVFSPFSNSPSFYGLRREAHSQGFSGSDDKAWKWYIFYYILRHSM